MTDKKSNESRRKLLKSIAVGSGALIAGKSLPEKWSAPVVESVLLPVHAATTGEMESEPSAGCVRAIVDEPRYANFNGGNYLPIHSPLYEEGCNGEPVSAVGRSIVYAPEGEAQAEMLCQLNAGVPVKFHEVGDVWFCDNS